MNSMKSNKLNRVLTNSLAMNALGTSSLKSGFSAMTGPCAQTLKPRGNKQFKTLDMTTGAQEGQSGGNASTTIMGSSFLLSSSQKHNQS